MLGFPAVRSVGTVYFADQGAGDIWLSDVECTGDESDLTFCSFRGWGVEQDCSHTQDVTVTCYGKQPLSWVGGGAEILLDVTRGGSRKKGRGG